MDLQWIHSGFAIDLLWICNGFESLTPQPRQPQPMCNGFTMDSQWICYGFSMDLQSTPSTPVVFKDLQWIYNGFTVELLWICNGFAQANT